MANSTVTQYTNIDEEFPVAGQDNDTQGFRDNFAAIKDALSSASGELGDYLTNGAKLNDAESDFQGNKITNAVIQSVGSQAYNTGNITSNVDGNSEISWTNGTYQNVTMANQNSTRLLLKDWPESGIYAHMRLAIRSNDSNNRTITFEAANAGALKVGPDWPSGDFIITSATEPTLVDVWTTDGGLTVFLRFLGQYSVLS